MRDRPPDVTVRSAGTDDAPDIARLQVDAWRAAYRGLLPDRHLDGLDVRDRDQRWRGLIGEHCRVLLATSGTEPVGFVSHATSRDPDATAGAHELSALYLLPAAWGRGVGKTLHDAAVRAMTDEGGHEATLWVLEANARARRFYERQGWTPDGTTKAVAFSGSQFEEIRYRLRLPPARKPQAGTAAAGGDAPVPDAIDA